MAKKPTDGMGNTPKAGAKATPTRRKPAARAKKPAAQLADADVAVDVDAKAAGGDASPPPVKRRKSPAKPKAKPAQARVRAPRRPKALVAPVELIETGPPEPVDAVAAPVPIDPIAPVADTPAPEATVATIPAVASPPHDEELPHGLSPVDLPVPETGEQPGLGWTSGILILTSLLLMLFNSFAIDKWARSLPVNEQSGQVVDAAAAWHGMMGQIDFNLPLETGRSGWHWVKALQWPASETDAADANSRDASGGDSSAD